MEEINFQENYESLNKQYKKNKATKAKIFLSIALAVVLVLSLLVITFSGITYSSRPTFVKDPTYVEVYIDGAKVASYDSDDEGYGEIISRYSKSFNYSYLTAIFTGSKGYTITENRTDTDNFYSSYSNGVGVGMSSKLQSSLGDNYIKFHYEEEQTIYSSNGNLYYTTAKTDGNLALTFTDMYFNIPTENNLENVTFYFGTLGISQKPKITTLTVKANTFKLYNYVSQL
jgi:hypothetical protein